LTFLALSLVPAVTSRAGVLAVYESTTPTIDSHMWTYRVSVPAEIRVQTGDFFTIYDFAGFNGGHSEPANWTFTSVSVGPVPVLIDVPGDDPTIPNLTWQYTGTTPITGEVLDVGEFRAESMFPFRPAATDWYASQATRASGNLEGTPVSNLAVIPVPVPEPGTLSTIAIGALLVLARRR
jgi:hypothetical protein